MALTFGPPMMGVNGIISIRRSPDKVIYIRWGDDWPSEPPIGENWLVPQDGKTIRFMYHPGSGLVLFCFCLLGRAISHAGMISKLVNEFGLSLPHYGEWIRADSKNRKGKYLVKTDVYRLGIQFRKSQDLRGRFRNFRAAMIHLRGLKAIPDDYIIRMGLEKGNIHRTLASDWV